MKKHGQFSLIIHPHGVPFKEEIEISLRDDGVWMCQCAALGNRWFHPLEAKTTIAALREAVSTVVAARQKKTKAFSDIMKELR